MGNTLFGFWEKNQTSHLLNETLKLDSLNERIVPAHWQPGLGEPIALVLLDAASHGIENAPEASYLRRPIHILIS